MTLATAASTKIKFTAETGYIDIWCLDKRCELLWCVSTGVKLDLTQGILKHNMTWNYYV